MDDVKEEPFVFQRGDEFVSIKLSQLVAMRTMLNEAIAKFDGALELVPRSNPDAEEMGFGFYVDGYTLNGTDKIGELAITAFDGRTCVIKSASLVAFLERRLEPNIFPEDQPKG